ncbi:MAG: DUF167 domain-containing protein [Candidatus Wildermuthbacteria bacterium]|nr:DUF167 domain-containing protein [Candidatus Wildermuthbacteria bacterium]
MRIFIKAKPSSKEEVVEKIDETHFVVAVKEPPVQGRANQAILQALAGYFGVSIGAIRIVSGFASKQKVIEIES